MSGSVHICPATNRCSIVLLDLPGKPKLEVDDPQQLERYWQLLEEDNAARERISNSCANARS